LDLMRFVDRLLGPNVPKLEARRDTGSLVALLERSSDRPTYIAAVEALCRLRDPASVGPLAHALTLTRGPSRRLIIEALRAMGGAQAADALHDLVVREDYRMLRQDAVNLGAAVTALSELGDARVVDALVWRLGRLLVCPSEGFDGAKFILLNATEQSTLHVVLDALSAVGDVRAIPILVKAVHLLRPGPSREDSSPWRHAVETLADVSRPDAGQTLASELLERTWSDRHLSVDHEWQALGVIQALGMIGGPASASPLAAVAAQLPEGWSRARDAALTALRVERELAVAVLTGLATKQPIRSARWMLQQLTR
jgi:hypothetical protein